MVYGVPVSSLKVNVSHIVKHIWLILLDTMGRRKPFFSYMKS